MRELLSGFLSNESSFGRLMTRWGIIIGANLMFVLFSLPLVTAGAAGAALYHVMFKTLRGDGVLNPFRQFWTGFRTNFKQATIVWVIALALGVFWAFDLSIVTQVERLAWLRYPLYAVALVGVTVLVYLLPTMAAFADTIPHLLRNSLYFALKKPWKWVILVFFNVFPLYLTYTDPQYLPLYSFLWTLFGFGAIAMLGARLLLPDFKPYLPLVDACGDFILDREGNRLSADAVVDEEGEVSAPERSEAEILEEMKKLGM